jgi:hypothetical protein
MATRPKFAKMAIAYFIFQTLSKFPDLWGRGMALRFSQKGRNFTDPPTQFGLLLG